ncbi:unnamed protein product [Kuraishia capsulata CBS 1993]|uniref:Uncharacterized protein n=1 Tax=Kuraishia capsulata CBS 1993 TaxID=1382522 RepID=W6MJY3_9ASCO|nr:uncharacterized protein KUCA_T00002828001 [Kuraishia capsulata CBS 1993]CDK26854.1 unnamed protein product [Kuraishia capsulata CBS 1993]
MIIRDDVGDGVRVNFKNQLAAFRLQLSVAPPRVLLRTPEAKTMDTAIAIAIEMRFTAKKVNIGFRTERRKPSLRGQKIIPEEKAMVVKV